MERAPVQDNANWKYKRVPENLMQDVVIHDMKYRGLLEKARAAQDAFKEAQHEIGDLFAAITNKLVAEGVIEKDKMYHLHSEFAADTGVAVIAMPEEHHGKRTLN